jgi:2,4'-dihydroxyacetophenone dioxygenase
MSTEPAPYHVADLVVPAIPEDERLWVPQAPNVWFRPILFNISNGYWINLLRIRRSGVLNKHLHPAPVFGYVITGSWRYLEHSWVARAGAFVYEPPGEIHTLVVDGEADEMITLFHVYGALLYVDEQGRQIGYDNVHSKLKLARDHFEKVGLGADYVAQFVR